MAHCAQTINRYILTQSRDGIIDTRSRACCRVWKHTNEQKWSIVWYFNAKDSESIATYTDERIARKVFYDFYLCLRDGELDGFAFPQDNEDSDVPLTRIKPKDVNPFD